MTKEENHAPEIAAASGFKTVAWIATAAFIAISLLVAPAGSTYQWSFAFLAPIIWLTYLARERLALHPFHFALFGAALLLHDLGSMGYYRRRVAGLEFDFYVHFYFGIVAGFVFFRALRRFYVLRGWKLWLAVALITLGVSGVHELVEWSTTLLMGPERGMLKIDPNDPFDTQKDLLNNLGGAMLAMLLYAIALRVRNASEEHRVPHSLRAQT
jgi:uncharacterized membrane protein YjdF